MLFLTMVFTGAALAQDAPAPQATPPAPAAKVEKAKPKRVVKKRRRRYRREKKDQGSKALNRFEADTVIKSVYRDRKGRPYDVDPD